MYAFICVCVYVPVYVFVYVHMYVDAHVCFCVFSYLEINFPEPKTTFPNRAAIFAFAVL